MRNYSFLRMVLEKLASFHAISYAMMATGNEAFNAKYAIVAEEAFTKNGFKTLMYPMYENALRTVIKILEVLFMLL